MKFEKEFPKSRGFSIRELLEGFLCALFGMSFTAGEALPLSEKKGKKFPSAGKLRSEQELISGAIRAVEIKLMTGSYTDLKKSCNLLTSLLKKAYLKTSSFRYLPSLTSLIRYRVFTQIGDYLFEKGCFAEALDFYGEISLSFPRDTGVLKKMARAYYTMGFAYLPEAERLFLEAQKIDPSDLEIYANLGRIMETWPGREEDALFIYREALQHCSSDLDRIYFYSRLRELKPGNAEIPLRMGRLYQRMGMILEARRYMQEAFELEEDPFTAIELAHACYLLNELPVAEKLLFKVLDENNNVEAIYASSYYLGLFEEGRGNHGEARDYYEKVPPESPFFWKAQLGKARIFLAEGRFLEAEQLMMNIPLEQKKKLEEEHLELCELLEKAMEKATSCRLETWWEHLHREDPCLPVKREIRRKSMGAAFWRKYEPLEVLGNGPSGQVWLGRERATGKMVAIKQINEALLEEPASVRRIQGQLRLMRSLDSPFFLQVFEDCYYNGSLYYAMEYMERGNLARLIKAGAPLTFTRAAFIILQLCAALEYIYEEKNKIFYGALKPENVFFTEDNFLKIGDFDLLWALENSRVFTPKILAKRKPFFRSFLYAAPERFEIKGFSGSILPRLNRDNLTIEGGLEGVDYRADLYSLGVIFFELLTGFLPSGEGGIKALLSFHRSRSLPSPRLFNPSIPGDLEEIILRLLAKSPVHRFSSPQEVSNAIKKVRTF